MAHCRMHSLAAVFICFRGSGHCTHPPCPVPADGMQRCATGTAGKSPSKRDIPLQTAASVAHMPVSCQPRRMRTHSLLFPSLHTERSGTFRDVCHHFRLIFSKAGQTYAISSIDFHQADIPYMDNPAICFFSTQCICCEACRLTIHALFHSLPLVQRQERQSTHSDFPHHSAGKGICMPVQSCPAESGSAIKGMHDRLILLFSDRRHTQYSRKQGSSRRRQNKALEAGLPAIHAHYSPYGSTGIPSLL